MNNDIVVKILREYPDAWKDKRLLKAILSDILPDDRLKRNLFCVSLDEGIPNEIFQCTDEINKQQVHIWIRRMVTGYGCSESVAGEIVETWVQVFMKNIDKAPENKHGESNEINIDSRKLEKMKMFLLAEIKDTDRTKYSNAQMTNKLIKRMMRILDED